jgi:3-oxoacyl-[acyl-carrier protein] reductase
MEFDGQSVLVTGGAVGIGRAIVSAFHACGASVAFTYKESSADAATLLQKLGDRAKAIQADLRIERDAAKAVEQAEKNFGPPTILVANAGGLVARSDVRDCSLELWNDVLATNLTSTFLTIRAALPGMLRGRLGSIVTIGSLAGRNGGAPGAAAYAAAKAAIISLTKSVARETANSGIRVNCVSPGRIATRFHERFSNPEARKMAAVATPMGREGSPEEVANAVLFLAGDKSGFITGETLEVNGGLLMD